MKNTPPHATTDSMTELADIPNINTQGTNASIPMDRVRQMLSPGTRRKFTANHNVSTTKTFGASLEDLVKRTPDGCGVPHIVQKICSFIEKHGLEQEGVFRINGNAKTLEKLKYSFDHHGDAEFDEEEDIMAIAGLLKLFLREMADAVIPQNRTKAFLSVYEVFSGNSGDNANLVLHLWNMVNKLPQVNYDLLKFLIKFLVVVAHHEHKNKMSPMALCIVFGPNLFKCGDGMSGMRDQGVTNQIVYKFITEYDAIFQSEGEESPVSEWKIKYKKIPPVRPPPPKFQDKSNDTVPIPSPRKIRRSYNSNHYEDDDDDWDKSDSSATPLPGSYNYHSPYISDDVDHLGRASPIVLDGDGLSIVESPVPTPKTHEIVERTISLTINEHIFGEEESTESNGIQSFVPSSTPDQIDRSEDESPFAVRDIIQRFEQQTIDPSSQPPPAKPETSVYMLTEDQVNGDGKFQDATDSEFGEVERRSDVLFMFKKPSGPKRRSPSRKFRRSSSDSSDLDAEITKLLAETEPLFDEARPKPVNLPRKPRKTVPKMNSEAESDDQSPTKSRIAFLDIHEENLQASNSAESSPTNNRKTFVPLLDLSTLHQTVDGSDAILAVKAHTVSYHMDEKAVHNDEDEENAVIISPRSKQLKRKNSWLSDDDIFEAPQSPGLRTTFCDSASVNTDIPPSPPVDQDVYRKHSADEDSQKLRQLTKKIQTLKRKIKSFEEHFERHHGYRPSQSDKAAKPEIKKYMTELSKARKDLKQLKEDAEMGNRSRHGSGASSSGETPKTLNEIQLTLENIYTSLKEKRYDQKRPQEINMMNREQIYDEKLAVQKALLHFESLHGRPTSKEEKDLMRPLYDRYRSIKRILSKPTSPRNTLDLETVPEDKPFEMAAGVTTAFKHGHPVRVPTADSEPDELDALVEMSEFTVTQDFSILRDTVRPLTYEKSIGHSPKMKSPDDGDESPTDHQTLENVQELTIEELHDELSRSRLEKKRIRKVLRVFETDFSIQNGRKVQKEDRLPMQTEYSDYKKIKAKIRLLEALLSKHQISTDSL
ncbi:protein FAM13A-like isoform X2 [Gigantopelta aegis]|uniref:protein FAM13A-like isoform X2 n=1 Tax=Gigantopelta aegis TaxID=1735272 RepID=UPI001B88B344|nr:protein FAM13A-like isoform X2 [Gigantopelta aegis]